MVGLKAAAARCAAPLDDACRRRSPASPDCLSASLLIAVALNRRNLIQASKLKGRHAGWGTGCWTLQVVIKRSPGAVCAPVDCRRLVNAPALHDGTVGGGVQGRPPAPAVLITAAAAAAALLVVLAGAAAHELQLARAQQHLQHLRRVEVERKGELVPTAGGACTRERLQKGRLSPGQTSCSPAARSTAEQQAHLGRDEHPAGRWEG